MPANAPTPKTTACTASRTPLPVSSTTTRTADVTQAAKRGPRTSICRDGAVITEDLRTADRARRDGRGTDLAGRTEAAAHAAQIHRAARGQQDAHGARVTDHGAS